MHTPEDLTPGERELEAALRNVAASASGIDPEALAFRLGRASERARVRRWQGATGGVALAGMVLSLVGRWDRPGPVPSDLQEVVSGASDVDRRAELPAASAGAAGSTGVWAPSRLVLASAYLRQRERALRLGDAALGGEGPAEGEAGVSQERVERAAPVGQGAVDFFLQALSAGRRL